MLKKLYRANCAENPTDTPATTVRSLALHADWLHHRLIPFSIMKGNIIVIIFYRLTLECSSNHVKMLSNRTRIDFKSRSNCSCDTSFKILFFKPLVYLQIRRSVHFLLQGHLRHTMRMDVRFIYWEY